MSARRLRIFVPSAATLLTDHRGHGEGLIAWNLLSGLAARGHDLVVCARAADLTVEPPFELLVTGWASHRESLEPLAYARATTRRFEALGGAKRFDAVHWLFPDTREELVWSPPSSVPFVVGPIAPPQHEARGQRRLRAGDALRAVLQPALRARSGRALARADAVLVCNDAARDGLPRAVRARARILPFGVDAVTFHDSPAPAGGPLVFVGKLQRTKGVRELLEAFARARQAFPDARLVLAGDGPDRPWLERRAKELALNGSLRLLGPVTHADVPELLRSASLVCLPSRHEPYGMAVLEAMASARAVLACDTAGPRELVRDGDGGRLVAPGDERALANALVELLRDPARLAGMGAFNRKRVEESLSLDRVLDELERVYEEVA